MNRLTFIVYLDVCVYLCVLVCIFDRGQEVHAASSPLVPSRRVKSCVTVIFLSVTHGARFLLFLSLSFAAAAPELECAHTNRIDDTCVSKRT